MAGHGGSPRQALGLLVAAPGRPGAGGIIALAGGRDPGTNGLGHGRERLAAALERLRHLPDFERTRLPGSVPDLSGITALLHALGESPGGLPAIHVAGSKGKGTTVLYLEALIRAAGYRTGAYLSPHLHGYEERYRIDGRPVEPGRLADLLDRVAAAVPGAPGAGLFDALTAAALVLFREEGVEAALVECGLGGRLDSTNVIDPRLAVITTVEREHEDVLGRGLARIAGEKAAIIKPGRPVVTGCRGVALTVVRRRAREVGAPCRVLDRDFGVRVVAPGEEGYRALFTPGEALCSTAVRRPQVLASLALAREACALFTGRQPDGAALAAAGGRVLPGRFEYRPGRPAWLFDGAHTPRSLLALARGVVEWFPGRPLHLVFGAARDKGWRRPLRVLSRLADHTWPVTLAGPRGVPATEMAAVARGAVRVLADPGAAYRTVRDAAGPEALVLVTGSYSLVGPVRAAWLADERREQ